MKVSNINKLQITVLLACAGLFFSCDSTEPETENPDSILSVDEVEAKKLRSFLEVGLGKKSEWKSHWENEIDVFEAQDFLLIQTDTIDPMEMPEKNPILKDDPLFPYQIPHPEGNGTMDIYSYKVEAQDGLETPFLNPDSEVIWYREDGMKERLLFMGPSGMFEDGLWINNTTFVVFGFFQEEAGFRPMAWVIELEDHKVHRYQLTKVTSDYETESYINQKIKKVDLSSNGVS
ncbi:hypothetical protein [Algoriphagus sp.]|uniref:hypothetical protein n=1 Tax=Algoriphagus sp. TaxID=1872435 RepID=UPI0025E75BB4|nr:hypothetical protein [Algoriphagus sp.]